MSRTQTKSLTPAQREVDAWNKQFGDRCAVRVRSENGRLFDTKTSGFAFHRDGESYVFVEMFHPRFAGQIQKVARHLQLVTPIDRIPANQPKYVLGQTGVIEGAE